MNKRQRTWIGLLALCVILLLGACSSVRPFGMMDRFGRDSDREFTSNGERIYFTGASAGETPVASEMPAGGSDGPMHSMMGGMMTCADCHGPQGRGGRVQMMMTSFTAPDIRWETLTAADHGHAEEEDDHGQEAAEMEHPPYTEETVARAITEGVNPAGEPLAWPMPRWRMSDEDLNDLIEYLETLD
jgi:cytochrome c553